MIFISEKLEIKSEKIKVHRCMYLGLLQPPSNVKYSVKTKINTQVIVFKIFIT